MDIAIIGPGAMGCLLGGYLAQSGHRLTLLDYRPERAEALNRQGIHIEGVRGNFTIPVRVTAKAGEVVSAELAILCVKAYHSSLALDMHRSLLDRTAMVLSLQNGLGNVEAISSIAGPEKTLAGITSEGANLAGLGQVIHAGHGETVIGEVADKKTDRSEILAQMFQDGGFNTRISRDIHSLLWTKLVVNIGINALTALLRVRNGIIARFDQTREIMLGAAGEAVDVAQALKIPLDRQTCLERVLEVAQMTEKNRSSMLMDVINERRTEIGQINGEVAARGEQLGIPTPINKLLANLIWATEKTYAHRE